jgi:hypothetical protein
LSIEANFDSDGNVVWCCLSKEVDWSKDKIEY